MSRDVFDIYIPYIVRSTWASGDAKLQLEDKLFAARKFLVNDFPKLIVDRGLAKFAPTAIPSLQTSVIGQGAVANHYHCRWSTDETVVRYNQQLVRQLGTYGEFDFGELNTTGRWDLMRDIYQLALAPECCKKAYFDSKYRDPYHELYDNDNIKLKRIASGTMNSLLAPMGLFISPIVPCSLNCEHAHHKSLEIAEAIKEYDAEIYKFLMTVVEMPLRIDSYRGNACVDTPMLIGVFATDAYKGKYIIDAKPSNPEYFNYGLEWVAKGARFPFKGQFSDLFGG